MLSEKLVIEHIHGQGPAGRSVQHYSNGGFLTTPITFLTHAYLTGRNAVQLAVLGLQYFCITAREGILITRNNHTFMPGLDFGYLRAKIGGKHLVLWLAQLTARLFFIHHGLFKLKLTFSLSHFTILSLSPSVTSLSESTNVCHLDDHFCKMYAP